MLTCLPAIVTYAYEGLEESLLGSSAASLTSARSHKQSTYSSSAGCSDAGANITVRRKLQMSRPCCVTQASSSSLSNP